MALKVGRPPGSKDFSDVEKNLIIETIKEYSLFNMQDKEIREIASRRLGRNISKIHLDE